MPANTRNITIAAHIDHGKTTFSDSLLATNDMVNSAQQGKIRLLDFLPIEQQRCITVKSSSVSLVHLSTCPWVKRQFEKEKVPALIQLFDSPGHCDFSQEVLSSLSICDGAILLIDAVEGVRSQTYTIIKQLVALKLDVVLCINKLDRLYEELKMSGDEVYFKLQQIVSDANQVIEEATRTEEYFKLTQNVVFASAFQGWGFTLRQVAASLSQMEILSQYSADDILDALGKSEMFLGPQGLQTGTQKPLFVQMVLDPIRMVYDMLQVDAMVEKNGKKLVKLFKQLNNGREMQGKPAHAAQYKELFLGQTYNLGRCALDGVLLNVRPPNSTANVYIQKIQKIVESDFCALTGKQLSDIDIFDDAGYPQASGSGRNFTLMRIVRQNKQEHVYVGTKFTAVDGRVVTIKGLFQPLGKTFKRIAYEQLSNGMIIGIETDIPLQNNSLLFQRQQFCAQERPDELAALSVRCSAVSRAEIEPIAFTSEELVSVQDAFQKIQRKVLQIQKPLIRVTVLPVAIQNYAELYRAVRDFASREMSVSWDLSPAGDIQLIVCGDVHLDLCVDALKKVVNFDFRIAQVHLMLRETIVPQTAVQLVRRTSEFDAALNERHDQVDLFLYNVSNPLDQRLAGFPKLSQKEVGVLMPYYYQAAGALNPLAIKGLGQTCGTEVFFLTGATKIAKTAFYAAAGPRQDAAPEGFKMALEDENGNQLFVASGMDKTLVQCAERAMRENVTQGPLCFEPVSGISMFFFTAKDAPAECEITEENVHEALESSVVPCFYIWPTAPQSLSKTETLRTLFRQSMVSASLRVLEPHFQIQVQGLSQHLQILTQLLSKLRAQSIEFTEQGAIRAAVPQEYALTLGDEIRSQTSGFAQLQFLGFDFILIPEDPRHNDVALTEEERIEFGEQGIYKKSDQKAIKLNAKLGQFDMDEDAGANVAQRVVNKVLRQKGLYIGELVEDAEKQRTIKRNR